MPLAVGSFCLPSVLGALAVRLRRVALLQAQEDSVPATALLAAGPHAVALRDESVKPESLLEF